MQEVASQTAALDLGYKPGITVDKFKTLGPKVLYLLAADDSEILRENIPKDTFVIYQGVLGAEVI